MEQFPKTLGACVDRLYKLREERIQKQAAVDLMKSEEELLRGHILANFAEAAVEGAKGKLAVASITRRTVAHVTDWDAFFNFIKTNDAFELVQKRVSETAYREYLKAGYEVPGADAVEVVSLSINKSTR